MTIINTASVDHFLLSHDYNQSPQDIHTTIQQLKKRWRNADFDEIKRLHHLYKKLSDPEKDPYNVNAAEKIGVIGSCNVLHAMEFQKVVENTHYVFTHGQEIGLSFVQQLIKQLFKEFNSSVNAKHRVILRVPDSKASKTCIDFEKKHFVKKGWFKKTTFDHTKKKLFNDTHKYKNNGTLHSESIAVDGDPTHWRERQCALYAMKHNYSFERTYGKGLQGENFDKQLLKEVFSHYLKDESKISELVEKAFGHLRAKREELADTQGVLWAIAVPKDIVDSDKNFVYFSDEYGAPKREGIAGFDEKKCRDVIKQDIFKKKLEGMQASDNRNTEGEVVYPYIMRMLTAPLASKEGVYGIACYAHKHELEKKYRNLARGLAKEVAESSEIQSAFNCLNLTLRKC